MQFQRINQSQQVWDEPFATDPIGYVPSEQQGLLDLWS
jgi:hypothetical protein